MLSCPPVNTSVTVDVAGWRRPRRTRVEDLTDEILVAAPVDEGDDHEPSLGTELTLSWEGDRGPMTVPVTLVAKELHRLLMWRFAPAGPVVITQRRHHVRVSTLTTVVLDLDPSSPSAHLVDLSEGGYRAVFARPQHVDVGARHHAGFAIDEEEFLLPSEVVRVEREDDHLLVGCRFVGLPPAEADRIRKVVFAVQARHQRLRS
jgi:c-di-GMP-binding flagellar brake protein YcgR